ncbi:response regulator [Sphingomonas sp.]|uniref:response regulator n=1 Tax=Sphingomonas sp. TaxID=28214 RepID=UPI0025F467CF|nr:response regulator [Sphingomonas sp.]
MPYPDVRPDSDAAKILVIDDDDRNLLALSEVLAPIAEVATAASGRDALRLLLRDEFAVILLDVFMPGLDGYETAALIRQREQTARIPIIFLSAVNKETEHLMRGYEMGAVDYVFKPVDPIVLKSKAQVFVDLYRMRRQVELQALAERELREAHYREQLSRRDAERQLEHAERRQATILRSLPMAIYELENSGKRQIVGGDLAQFVGEQPEVDVPLDWEARVHEADRATLTISPDDPDFVTTEYRWIGADGVTRHILDQRVAISVHGEARWAGTLLDISERKNLEARLVHRGKLDALGQLTGGVAHDFNNLLAAVLGGIDLLQKRVEFGARESRIIEQMRHASVRGAELVRRMMSFARQQELMPTSIEPSSLCEAVAGLVAHTLGGKTLVDWRCANEGLHPFVDRSQLELALMNLVINARDAMPDGGTIHVAIEVDDHSGGKPTLAISVRDEGVGMPEAVMQRVTEPFFTTKESGKGTGLGLAMVAGFVEQSGGELRLDSKEGFGTTVTMILPATREGVTDIPDANGQGLDWLAGKRMMLVDDDEQVRIVLAERFRDAGAVVEEFAGGEGAIDALKARPDAFDFLLTDFAMPGIDGLETLRKATVLAPTTRVALMTGYADDFELGPKDHFAIVTKPLNIGRLLAAFGVTKSRQLKASESPG